jgi:hypothetical protein
MRLGCTTQRWSGRDSAGEPATPADPLRHELLCSRKTALLISTLLLLGCAAVCTAQPTPPATELCGEVPTIARELTRISGLRLRRPVPCEFITKEKIGEFLKKKLKESASPEEIRAEELALKKFGLVPQDFDLARSTVDLLTEQAAAFYDYDHKKLVITESAPSDTQEPVLAHELAHALADQNFNLAKFTRKGRQSDDASTARLAVMEGQATWLMSEYLARKSGRTLKDSPDLVRMMTTQSASDGQFPVYESVPLYLRRTLIFPYTKGMLFQNAVFERDGDRGLAEVFRRPPVSTGQILHPEEYFADVKPTEPKLPTVRLRGYKGLIGGTVGELDVVVLLEQYASPQAAAGIPPHWRGSSFELRENKQVGRVVLLYAAEWDSEDSARQFLAAYREVLRKKWKKTTVDSETADDVTGTGDDGRYELRRRGAIVTSVEGLEPAIH